jgi:hypothetical protein
MTHFRATIAVVIAVLAVNPRAAATHDAAGPLPQVSHIHGIAVDRTDPSRLYLATHHGLYLVAADGTVQRISSDHDDLMGFTAHPRDADTFFASGHPETGGNLGFMASTDRGVTWRQLSPGLRGPVDFHQMDVSKSDPSIIYGVYEGLQRSPDGGRTWELVGQEPPGLFALAISGRDPATLYAATRVGLLLSRDGGKSWQLAHRLRLPATMVKTEADGSVFAYFYGYGLVRGSEGSDDWTLLGTLPGDRALMLFAVAPGRLYGLTQANELLLSVDAGRSWQPFGN